MSPREPSRVLRRGVLDQPARERRPVLIIGAGPAGLTAGYLLAKRGWPVRALEADPTYVGGLSRTVEYRGYHFDIGGHRFFSKSKVVEDLWSEILPDDMLVVRAPRGSTMTGGSSPYPLKAGEALTKLGVIEAGAARSTCWPRHSPSAIRAASRTR